MRFTLALMFFLVVGVASRKSPRIERNRPARPDPSAACTKEDYKACLNSTETCEQGEKPEYEDGQCCRTCIPASSRKKLDSLLTCAKKQRQACGDDEEPFVSDSTSCPTCRRKKKACTPVCADNQVCAGKKRKCRHRGRSKFRLAAKEAAYAAALDGLDADGITEILMELVDRYCDNKANEEKCVAGLTAVADMVITKASDEEWFVDIPDEDDSTDDATTDDATTGEGTTTGGTTGEDSTTGEASGEGSTSGEASGEGSTTGEGEGTTTGGTTDDATTDDATTDDATTDDATTGRRLLSTANPGTELLQEAVASAGDEEGFEMEVSSVDDGTDGTGTEKEGPGPSTGATLCSVFAFVTLLVTC